MSEFINFQQSKLNIKLQGWFTSAIAFALFLNINRQTELKKAPPTVNPTIPLTTPQMAANAIGSIPLFEKWKMGFLSSTMNTTPTHKIGCISSGAASNILGLKWTLAAEDMPIATRAIGIPENLAFHLSDFLSLRYSSKFISLFWFEEE